MANIALTYKTKHRGVGDLESDSKSPFFIWVILAVRNAIGHPPNVLLSGEMRSHFKGLCAVEGKYFPPPLGLLLRVEAGGEYL